MSKKRSGNKGKGKKALEGNKANYYWHIAILFSIALLTIIAYFRSLKGPLIFDDVIYIAPSKLRNILHDFSFRARSIAELSFALNYYFSGMNVVFFRFSNVVLHLGAAFTASYFALTMLRLPSLRDTYRASYDDKTLLNIAFFVAALFALHPIQTSAVNYITQRMAIMAAMFSFAGFIFYTRGVTTAGKGSVIQYLFSAFFFVLAILSKENALMTLFMLPIYDFIFLSSSKWGEFRRRFITLTVLMITVALIAAYTMGITGFAEKVIALLSNPNRSMERYAWGGKDINWTPIEYLLTELRVVSRYIFLLFIPLPSLMVFDYSNAYPVSRSLFDPLSTLLSLLFLATVLVFSLKNIKKVPLISFGILWYLVTISLESFIALGLDPYFEYRNYLPSFGIFLAIGSSFLYADVSRIKIKKETIFVGLAVVLCFLTFVRNGAWTTEDSLWKDTIEKAPNNLRALISLSSIYIREKNFQEAQECVWKAGKVKPLTDKFRADLLFNQASIYKETNRRAEALAILKKLESNPSMEKGMPGLVSYFLGDMLREEGDNAGAKKHLEKALEQEGMRRNPGLLVSLGLVSRSLGEIEKAESYFKRAANSRRASVVPYVELGDILLMRNDVDGAERYYKEVLAGWQVQDNLRKRALFGFAQAQLLKGKIEESEQSFKEVIGMDPQFYLPYIFLGDIYLTKKDPDRSLSYLEKALSFKRTFMTNEPNTKMLYYYLGRAYLLKGDRKTARKNFEIFLSVAAHDARLEKQISTTRQLLAREKN